MKTNFNELIKIDETRDCKRCKGTGTVESTWIWDAVSMTGHHGPGPCKECDATGKFAKPDFNSIFETITKGTKGIEKRTFRASKPKFENEFKNKAEGRAYYVWRLARFHGGKDVTMPVVASMCTSYDPYEKELDAFASLVAKGAFGTDMAAAYRWANALGGSVAVPAGQPASAYPCGPVTDNNKPEVEQAELF